MPTKLRSRRSKRPNKKGRKTRSKRERAGNPTAANIPSHPPIEYMIDAIEEGEIKGGETCVFTAVGAGLSWGACALKLGERVTPLGESDADLPPFDGTGVDAIRESIDYFLPGKLK